MSQSPQNESKYRPYLTLKQITKILQSLKGNPEPEDSDLISSLEVLVWKANQGLAKPSYTAQPSWQEKMGFAESPSKTISLNEKINLYVRWKTLHGRTKGHFTPVQQAIIDEYRYTNSLMDDAEEQEYVCALMSAVAPVTLTPTTEGK